MTQEISDFPYSVSINARLAIKAAIKASEAVMAVYNTNFISSDKIDGEPVTEADISSNDVILNELKKSGLPIISEENWNAEEKKNFEKFWLVDPLDGTADFINKTGEFAVMIALSENKKSILGVVSLPVSGQLYLAEAGKGAWLRENNAWKKLKTSRCDSLKSARVEMSRHHIAEEEKKILSRIGISEYASRGSCLKTLDIASGNSELYFTLTNKIKLWDTAAANCVLSEAGGIATDISGREIIYASDDMSHENGILAANNAHMCQQIIDKFNNYADI